jgi:organic hydroperoxide reductase OsmC/OhrA
MSDFTTRIRWTGDRGDGTQTYRGYDRTWNIEPLDKSSVECSNDPAIGGDPTKYNPEELLLASLAGCHMLWYLHLASNAKIVVRGYEDDPLGIGVTGKAGEGQFERAILRPVITVERGTDLEKADALHEKVHRYCFIARSINFPVSYEARYVES